jgi:tRNA-splicing ligase RtcB
VAGQAGYFDYLGSDGDIVSSRFLLSGPMLGRLAASGVIDLIEEVSTLPHIRHPLLIYPDASPKRYGFPNGIALTTDPGWVYPLSAPDMGCGFELIDTGIELDPEAPNEQKAALLSSINCTIATSSRARVRVKTSVREILLNGLSAVSEPTEFERLRPSEEHNTWPASCVPLNASDLDTLQDSLGAATGHFVAVHMVRERHAEHAPPLGRIIVVVHTGAAPIRDLLNARRYLLTLAEWSIDAGLIDPESAASGLFPIPLESLEGREFIGLAMACRNFGYANRQIVADRVLQTISRVLSNRQIASAVELRHVDHVAFEGESGAVLARRGLQPIHTRRPSFIAGGAFSHAYICDTPAERAPWGNLSPHGNPVLPRSIMGPVVARVAESDQYLDRGYGRDLESNIPFDEDQYLADTFSLEDQMRYMTAMGWSRRIALLSPLVNFQDLAL